MKLRETCHALQEASGGIAEALSTQLLAGQRAAVKDASAMNLGVTKYPALPPIVGNLRVVDFS